MPTIDEIASRLKGQIYNILDDLKYVLAGTEISASKFENHFNFTVEYCDSEVSSWSEYCGFENGLYNDFIREYLFFRLENLLDYELNHDNRTFYVFVVVAENDYRLDGDDDENGVTYDIRLKLESRNG